MGEANKLLLPWGDSTILGSVLRKLQNVIVVLGHEADLVRSAIGDAPSVINPDFADGLGGTIATGVAASPGFDAYLIVLSDMPNLRADVIETLIAQAAQDRIVVPIYTAEPERYGHPIVFGADFYAELTALRGANGARSIIQAHPEAVLAVAIDGNLEDIDTPQTYAALKNRANSD